MNPLDYPSLELCKRLTEAGFPETQMERIQNSFFKDWLSMTYKARNEMFDPRCFENLCETSDFKRHYVCPSIAELLRELPPFINVGEPDLFDLEIVKQGLNYLVRYMPSLILGRDKYLPSCGYKISAPLPDALAEMWLWCKENNHLTK